MALIGPLRAEGQYDGTYAGKRVRVDGPPEACPAEDDVSVTIKGIVLTFTNSQLQNYGITIEPSPDGSFRQSSVSGGTVVNIQGRIAGDTLDADVVSLATTCKHHWHLTKQRQ
jgi:hypothetical protein